MKLLFEKAVPISFPVKEIDCILCCIIIPIASLRDTLIWLNTGERGNHPDDSPLLSKKNLRKLLKQQGLIEPSNTPWSSPIVLVKKNDGTLRFCVDDQRLNEDSQGFLSPTQSALKAMTGMKFISTLNLRSGYSQVKLDETAKEKKAFSTGDGVW